MSHTRVLIAVTVAALLAVAAVFLLRGGNGEGEGPERALVFDPAQVAHLEVVYSPGEGGGEERGRVERLVRAGPERVWHIVWTGPDGHEASWPAAAAQVRSALRILSTMEGRRAERGSRVEGVAAELRIGLEDGSERVLRLSGRGLGGRVLAEAGEAGDVRTLWLDRNIMEMLVGRPGTAGPRAWRDPGALPGLGGEVSRVSLRSSGGWLSLARVQGRWALREPVAETAEPEAVSRLFSTVGNIRIVDYLEEVPRERTGLEEPVATLVLEADRRDGRENGTSVTIRRTLDVGHTADLAGRNVFARARQETIGAEGSRVDYERVLVVSGETLASIAMDPAAYVSRRSVQTPASEIGVVLLRMGAGEIRYQRTVDGWQRSAGGSEPRPLERTESEAFAGAMQLLTQERAMGIGILAEEPEVMMVQLELHTIGGMPIGSLGAVVVDDGKTVATVSGGIQRQYEGQAAQQFVRWVAQQSE